MDEGARVPAEHVHRWMNWNLQEVLLQVRQFGVEASERQVDGYPPEWVLTQH